MAKKVGDVVIPILILVFCIGGISQFISEAELTSGISTEYVSSRFSNLDTIIQEDTNNLKADINQKTDNTSDFTPDLVAQQERRGGEIGGITNLFSKNILVRFFTQLQEDLEIPGIIIVLVLGIIGVLISTIFIRVFTGEGRV